ncbi:MAG: hypothetical protein GVY24_00320 [Planctomycetes bacterium]|nr:hypothetical protein [Planctomycetota bacterium]
MRIAIPLSGGVFSAHFGRSDAVLLCEADPATRGVDRRRRLERPKMGCDALPAWLGELAVDVVVCGGMGAGAREGLARRNIRVSAGHVGDDLEAVIASFLDHPEGLPQTPCRHEDHEHHHCRH